VTGTVLVTGGTIINEPKRIACGALDFIINHGQTPIGYAATSAPQVAQGAQAG